MTYKIGSYYQLVIPGAAAFSLLGQSNLQQVKHDLITIDYALYSSIFPASPSFIWNVIEKPPKVQNHGSRPPVLYRNRYRDREMVAESLVGF